MGIREGFVLMEGRGSKINHAYVDGFSGFDRRREDRGREQEAWHVSCAPDRKRKGEVDPYVFSTFFARARADPRLATFRSASCSFLVKFRQLKLFFSRYMYIGILYFIYLDKESTDLGIEISSIILRLWNF